jgi:hypothetical protein
MKTKTAKLWVNHASMTGDPSAHVAYLINGHQIAPDEQQPAVWTKSLPKKCKTDRKALIAHWRGIHARFLTERATPDSMVHHNAKVTARQFVINLPNGITDDQVHQLAKGVLKDFPRHIPVSMVLHRTSNRGQQHMHLQGLFSYRNGGYGKIVDDFRMNITGLMKLTVTRELTNCGYFVDKGSPGSINSKGRKWVTAQGSVEQRRNPRFMTDLASKATNPKVQAYCTKLAKKMTARITAPSSVDATLNIMTTMTDLMSIKHQDTFTPPQDQSSTGHPRGTTKPPQLGRDEPLTQQALENALQKARKWNHSKKNSRNLGS